MFFNRLTKCRTKSRFSFGMITYVRNDGLVNPSPFACNQLEMDHLFIFLDAEFE